MPNIIEINEISKTYDGFKLDSVSFNVPENSIVGFVGQNGAGKTTTINSILNIINIESGNIKIFGLDHRQNETDIKEKIAVVFDELPFPEMFNLQIIEKMMQNVYIEWDSEVFKNYITKFQLPTKKPLSSFSKGMKMKAQIAVALSHNAKLLIMDEATAGLDPVMRDQILDIFVEYKQRTNCSILLSSHILSDIDKIADTVVCIHQGNIVATGIKDCNNILHTVLSNRNKLYKLSQTDYNGLDNTAIVEIKQLKDWIFVQSAQKLPFAEASLEEVLLFFAGDETL